MRIYLIHRHLIRHGSRNTCLWSSQCDECYFHLKIRFQGEMKFVLKRENWGETQTCPNKSSRRSCCSTYRAGMLDSRVARWNRKSMKYFFPNCAKRFWQTGSIETMLDFDWFLLELSTILISDIGKYVSNVNVNTPSLKC